MELLYILLLISNIAFTFAWNLFGDPFNCLVEIHMIPHNDWNFEVDEKTFKTLAIVKSPNTLLATSNGLEKILQSYKADFYSMAIVLAHDKRQREYIDVRDHKKYDVNPDIEEIILSKDMPLGFATLATLNDEKPDRITYGYIDIQSWLWSVLAFSATKINVEENNENSNELLVDIPDDFNPISDSEYDYEKSIFILRGEDGIIGILKNNEEGRLVYSKVWEDM